MGSAARQSSVDLERNGKGRSVAGVGAIKQELGWYFPQGETHLPAWMRKAKQYRDGVLQYQFHKYLDALEYVRQRNLAVDIGAHVGHWSRNMALDFVQVHAFEPVPAYAECWRKNMAGVDNAVLHEVALGDRDGVASMECDTNGSHGDTFISKNGNAAKNISVRPFDSFALGQVDFLKCDCEGFEYFVMMGGEKTIRDSRPCIIIEQKFGMAARYGIKDLAAVRLLREWGATERKALAGDYILSWD